MTAAVRLITRADPVAMFSLGPQKAKNPSVAVVYASADGELHLLDGGKPMNWSDQILPRYRTRYEVDLSDHQRTVQLHTTPPLAKGGVYAFETVLNVGFKVTDPVEIVRRNIQDGLTVVYDHLIFVCRQIAAEFLIEEAKEAEDALNARFRSGEYLAEGIMIYMCRARLSPDADARRYLQAQVEAKRANVVRAEVHDVSVNDAMRDNALELIRQSGQLETRRREAEAMAGRPLDARQLIMLHLERFPQDTEKAMGMLAAVEAATVGRLDAASQQQRELFEFMVANNLVRPVDVAKVRDEVMSGLQETPALRVAPATVGWDDPLPGAITAAQRPKPVENPSAVAAVSTPGLIPVYIVIDESLGSAIDDINVGLRALYEALRQAPEIANVIRLSVFGFASDVDIQLALATVGDQTAPPQLSARTPARYIAAFQQLLDCIPRDAATLKAQHPSVRRPQVLLLTGGTPAEDSQWAAVHRQLVDRHQLRSAPDIVVCGVGDVPAQTLADMATRPEYAFVAIDGDLGTAISRFSTFVRAHVLGYGQAVLDGDQGPVIRGPEGFRPVSSILP